MHIQIKKGDIGRYVILPGDPARCEKIARYFDEPQLSSPKTASIRSGRRQSGRRSGRGLLDRHRRPLCGDRHGGARRVRCGHVYPCRHLEGGIADEVKGGDIVIATSAASNQEGTRSANTCPSGFPRPPASTSCSRSNIVAAEKLGYPHHVGVIQSKDGFYGEIRRR